MVGATRVTIEQRQSGSISVDPVDPAPYCFVVGVESITALIFDPISTP